MPKKSPRSKVQRSHAHAGNRGPTSFESLPKNKSIKFRIPVHLFEAVQNLAKQDGMSCQRFIRQALERNVGKR